MENDVFEPVVPSGAAGSAHTKPPRYERDLIGNNENTLRRDLEIIRKRAHRLAGEIHKRLRLYEQHIVPADVRAGRERARTEAVD